MPMRDYLTNPIVDALCVVAAAFMTGQPSKLDTDKNVWVPLTPAELADVVIARATVLRARVRGGL